MYWASTYSLLLFLCCPCNLCSNFGIVRFNRYLCCGTMVCTVCGIPQTQLPPSPAGSWKTEDRIQNTTGEVFLPPGNETTFKSQNQDCLSKGCYMGVRERRIRVGELFFLYIISFHFLVFSYLALAGSQREAPKSQWWWFRVLVKDTRLWGGWLELSQVDHQGQRYHKTKVLICPFPSSEA